ncbi:MAG TPA: sensor histidine kinase [Bacillota bacterium]|nr:sensor histidine kinase [Bacillota bacterium]HNT02148.1 sensor histidine kinase [Bacillota bacterium]HPA54297.1 sensor histidine kinase [Bacillota bacterium]HPX68594.1 sensor histidine kinase [Bacillota bacterium]HQA66007.1 sensor histidine kinase [Bacillota bacterium]
MDRLNEIIKNTVDIIEKSRSELFSIAESSRTECQLVEEELEKIRIIASDLINQVDMLVKLDKECRYQLMIVSKNIKDYKEEDVKRAYDKAKDLQVELMTKKAEEQLLIQRRSELERRLKIARDTANKAESLVNKVGVAMGYLTGELQDLSIQMEDIKQKQYLGIKIIKAQEEERKRVAREIHDGPAQLMANLVIKTELCEKLIDMDKEKAKEELGSLRGFLRSSLSDVRKIIYDLRPMSLDDLGLVPTLQRYISNYIEQNNISVNFSVLGDTKTLKPVVELAAFRIVQEALTNIKRHSGADNAVVRVEFTNDQVNLLISDDGKGFDKNKLWKAKEEDAGYGLLNMKERVELLNGKFDVKTARNKGTKVFASLSLNIAEEG